MPAPTREGEPAMGDARALSDGDRALATDLERLLVIWRQSSAPGRQLSGLPVDGLLGISLGDYLV
eukprot:10270326-Alexandrium_andersonii.AAC.1